MVDRDEVPGLEHRAVTKKPYRFALYQGTALAGPKSPIYSSGFSPCGLLLREVGETIGKLFRRMAWRNGFAIRQGLKPHSFLEPIRPD